MGTPFEKVALQYKFKYKEGILLGIIGHTGSGKSTLVQMMNALLMPTHGVVYINGRI